MSLWSWWSRGTTKTLLRQDSKGRRRFPRQRLSLEALEDRLAPSVAAIAFHAVPAPLSNGYVFKGTIGSTFKETITGSGGSGTYSFQVAPGWSLPNGLHLENPNTPGQAFSQVTGQSFVVAGTPTTNAPANPSGAGVYNVAFLAQDAAQNSTLSDTIVYQFQISPHAGTFQGKVTGKGAASIVGNGSNSLVLPAGITNQPYSAAVTVSGATLSAVALQTQGPNGDRISVVNHVPGLTSSNVTGLGTDGLLTQGTTATVAGLTVTWSGNKVTIGGTPTVSVGGLNDPMFLTLSDGTNNLYYNFAITLSPKQIAKAYGFDTLRLSGGIRGTGAGQTVVVLSPKDNSAFVSSTNPNYANSDLNQFTRAFALTPFARSAASPGPFFFKLDQNGGTNFPPQALGLDDPDETPQDIEWVHALAPGANIVVLEGDVATSLQTIANWVSGAAVPAGLAANIPAPSAVTSSFGGIDLNNPLIPGVTFVASSGDFNQADGSQGYTLPAKNATVVGTGYTQVVVGASGAYQSEAAVLGGFPAIANQVNGSMFESGGGIDTTQPQPTYQVNVPNTSTTPNPVGSTGRTGPDVSFNGAEPSGVAVYNSFENTTLVNFKLPNSAASTTNFAFGGSPWGNAWGTSMTAPSWAALFAIVNQGRKLVGKQPLSGNETLPLLYSLAGPTDFNQIANTTDGTTTTPIPANKGTPLYNAYAGLGTPKVKNLVPDLIGMISTATDLVFPMPFAPPPVPTLMSAIVGHPFRQTFTAAPGFTLKPLATNGLRFTSTGRTGVLSGVPSTNGTFPITLSASDAFGNTNTVTYNLTVANAPFISTATNIAPDASSVTFNLAPAVVGEPFRQTFNLLDRSYTLSSTVSGNLDGLSFRVVGGQGVLSGTPSAAGPFPFTLTARDQSGQATSVDYVLNVASERFAPKTTTPVVVSATLGGSAPTAPILTGKGGSGHASSYTIASPKGKTTPMAPDGLGFSTPTATGTGTDFTVALTGTLTPSGATTPTTGVFPSLVEVADDFGNVIVQPFTLLVAAQSGTTPLSLFAPEANGHALPVATVNKPHTQMIGAFGGVGNLTFEHSHPDGVGGLTFSQPTTTTLSAAEGGLTYTSVKLEGTPTTAGAFNFSVTVRDSSTPANTSTYQYTLTVKPDSLAIGPDFLRPGSKGTRYVNEVPLLGSVTQGVDNPSIQVPFQLFASGGSGPYKFSATGLPPGMAMTSTGVLGGIPAAVGDFNVRVTLTDSANSTVSKTFLLTILPTLTQYYTPNQIKHAFGLDRLNLTGKGITVVIVERGDTANLVSSFDPTYGTTDLSRFNRLFNLPDFGNAPGKPLFLKLDSSGTSNPASAGTITSSGTTVTGTGTTFMKDAKANGHIGNPNTGYFEIASVNNDQSITLKTAPAPVFNNAPYSLFGNAVDTGESTQDVQWVHALAPLANIVMLVNSPSDKTAVDWHPSKLDQSVKSLINPTVFNQLAHVAVVSNSNRHAEQSSQVNENDHFKGNGHVVFVSSAGDQGAYGTISGVFWEATSPNVLGVGESQVAIDSLGNYRGELGAQNTGAGVSAFQTGPDYQKEKDAMGHDVVPDVLSKVPVNGGERFRTTPDVTWVGQFTSAVSVYNSFPPSTGTNAFKAGFGTSMSTPFWAALTALVDQGRKAIGKPLLSSDADSPDDIHRLLYRLFLSFPGDFHNVTAMTDNTSNPPGYNLHTGLGSPVANRLIPHLINPPATSQSAASQVPPLPRR